MEMMICCTSFGVKLPMKIFDLGITIANGTKIKFKQGKVIRSFIMSKPISFKGDGALGFTMAGSKWFKVENPDKNVLIEDFENKVADFSISSTCSRTMDMTLTIFNENMQPWYEIKRVEIPTPDNTIAVSTTEFTLRATLIMNSISYDGKRVSYHGKI
jgi:hypothetical protein